MAPRGRAFLLDGRPRAAHRLVDGCVGPGKRRPCFGAGDLGRLVGRARVLYLDIHVGELTRPPFDLVAPLEGRLGPAQPNEPLRRHDVPSDADRLPALGEPGQQRQGCLQAGQPDGRPQELPGHAGRVAPDRLGQGATPGVAGPLRHAAARRVGCGGRQAQRQVPTPLAQGDDVRLVHHVGLDRGAQRGLHRGTQSGRHLEPVGQRPAPSPRRRLDPAGTRSVGRGGKGVKLRLEGGMARLHGGPAGGRVRGLSCRGPGRRVRGCLRRAGLRLGGSGGSDRLGMTGEGLCLARQGRSRFLGGMGRLVGPLGSHRGVLGDAGELVLPGPSRPRRRRGSCVARPVLVLQGRQLGRSLGDLALEAGDFRGELGRRRDGAAGVGQGHRTPRLLQPGLDRRPLGRQRRSFAFDGCRLGSASFIGDAVLGQPLAGVVQGLAQLTCASGMVGQGRQQIACLGVGGGEGVRGGLRLGARELEVRLGTGQRRSGGRPAVRGQHHHGAGEGRPGALARDLLLGLLGQPADLRAQLAGDVAHPGQVRFGLQQARLRLPPTPLVAAHAGGLLEQRPAFLRPQREGLVDHALADEQEGVVGQVRAVQQVHQVAQAHPLAVQQVLVLARAVEPPRQVDLAVVHRQQPVAVVEDQA